MTGRWESAWEFLLWVLSPLWDKKSLIDELGNEDLRMEWIQKARAKEDEYYGYESGEDEDFEEGWEDRLPTISETAYE